MIMQEENVPVVKTQPESNDKEKDVSGGEEIRASIENG